MCAALYARQVRVGATPAAEKYLGGFDAGLGKKKTVLFARFQLILNYFQAIATSILRLSYQTLSQEYINTQFIACSCYEARNTL